MANLISILPTDGSVLYEGAIVPIEVTLTLDEGQDLPPGCAVTASVPSGSYGQLEIGSEFGITSTLPVVKINATTARAVFYLALSSGEVGAAVTLNISVWPADFATAVSPKYEIGVKPRITYHDPRPVYLTTAPDAAQTPETFLSIRYAAKVEDNDNAVPGYVMEWRQVWDSALFTNMRPFGAANGAPLPVLPEAIAPKAFVNANRRIRAGDAVSGSNQPAGFWRGTRLRRRAIGLGHGKCGGYESGRGGGNAAARDPADPGGRRL